jgi:hypothetical protein
MVGKTMSKNSALITAGVIFIFVAILHLIRADLEASCNFWAIGGADVHQYSWSDFRRRTWPVDVYSGSKKMN